MTVVAYKALIDQLLLIIELNRICYNNYDFSSHVSSEVDVHDRKAVKSDRDGKKV